MLGMIAPSVESRGFRSLFMTRVLSLRRVFFLCVIVFSICSMSVDFESGRATLICHFHLPNNVSIGLRNGLSHNTHTHTFESLQSTFAPLRGVCVCRVM